VLSMENEIRYDQVHFSLKSSCALIDEHCMRPQYARLQ
jgi:hypothetical protein